MVVYVNGEPEQWDQKMSLSQWLEAKGLLGQRMAIEVNGGVVSKSKFNDYYVQENDKIEVIVAVGGG